MTDALVPGWYGKLPTLGDFASRRLDAGYIEAWDGWLAEGLGGLREQRGEAWLQAYLDAPAWRFVLMPGVLPRGADGAKQAATAGVLMPSVDRVGRYFPLTLACGLPLLPTALHQADALLAWLHRQDDLAADALHDDWSIEQLEQALADGGLDAAELAPPQDDDAATVFDLDSDEPALDDGVLTPTEALTLMQQGEAACLATAAPPRSELARLLAYHVACLGLRRPPALSFWWSGDPRGGQLLIARGLPRGADFAALFTPPAG